jgi:hypothetical protein
MSNLSKTVQHRNLAKNKSVATKPYVELGHMSNQWKTEFVNGDFRIQVSGEVMAKFRQDPDLCRKVWSV